MRDRHCLVMVDQRARATAIARAFLHCGRRNARARLSGLVHRDDLIPEGLLLWLLSPCGRGLATHLTVEVAAMWVLLGKQIGIP